jgi:hypothetical protein
MPKEKLLCWTPEALRDLRPRLLTALLGELADERLEQARKRRAGKPPAEQRRQLQADWARVLGNVQRQEKPQVRRLGTEKLGTATVERLVLTAEPGITVPVLLLLPPHDGNKKAPVVVAISQAGKSPLLRARAADVAALLEAGVAVCLPDLRGIGETSPGGGRGRSSAATALSSSQLMLGETLVGAQLRGLRAVLSWLRTRGELDPAHLAVWGDSLAPTNPPGTRFAVPCDDDAALPRQSEPLGGMLAMLAALYEDDVRAVYARGGLAGFRTVLDNHLVLIPHDVVVPGALPAGDLGGLAAGLAPRPLCLAGTVDGLNRQAGEAQVRAAFRAAIDSYEEQRASGALTIVPEPTGAARWLLTQLR